MEQDKPATIEALFERIENYGKTTLELGKLKVVDKSADVVSSLITQVVLSIFVVLFLLVLNIGAGLWLGELLGKAYYGFFVLTGFYLIIGILVYLFREKLLKEPLNDSLIKQLLKKKAKSNIL